MGKKKPRILFIASFPPPVHGSAMVSQYIKDSQIINDAFDCDYVNLSTSRSMEEIGKKNWKKIFRLTDSLLNVFNKLIFNKYELCYLAITCHGKGFLKDFPFVLLCKLFRKRIVIHQHNKGMSKDIDRFPYNRLLPFAYKDAKVILLSERLYPDISKIVKREQVLICPNGIPPMYEGEKVFKRNNEVPKILFLSNLIETKGVYVLLDACKLLKERGHKFNCFFVGGETKEINREKFEEEVKKRGLDEFVNYKGRKYGPEKQKELEEADAFAFPTFYENECFPLVILEAMQYHLPIVTTNEGGIPDVVRHKENGLISTVKDPESLAMNIEILINDERLRQTLGNTGYNIYKENFTQKVFEKRMAEILTSIFKNERR